jgi:hypothetical protein
MQMHQIPNHLKITNMFMFYLFWFATITIEPSQQVQEFILPLTIDICYVDFDVDFQFGFWLP